jgi:sulfide dehydrogenase cytochrome subunit
MQKLTRFAIATAIASLAISGAAAAADAKLLQSCTDCHGNNGLTQAQEIPSIAGISSPVIEGALAGFKAKKLPCAKVSYQQGDTKRPQTDMCSVAANLNDAQIKDLADHFSKQPYKAMQQPFDAAKAEAGKKIHARDCENCHTKNGRDPADDSSLLGGQPVGYLKAALGDFKAGKRQAEKKMTEKVNKLSPADLEALAHFYASVK